LQIYSELLCLLTGKQYINDTIKTLLVQWLGKTMKQISTTELWNPSNIYYKCQLSNYSKNKGCKTHYNIMLIAYEIYIDMNFLEYGLILYSRLRYVHVLLIDYPFYRKHFRPIRLSDLPWQRISAWTALHSHRNFRTRSSPDNRGQCSTNQPKDFR
jgi:hypothetical protein